MSKLNKKIHDIRKPLNTISMQAELIKILDEANENNPKLQAAANKIILNSKACSELLQQLFEDLSADTATTTINSSDK